jgi:hypothetical protein
VGCAAGVGDARKASVRRLLVVVVLAVLVVVATAWAGDVPTTPEHVAQDWLEAGATATRPPSVR